MAWTTWLDALSCPLPPTPRRRSRGMNASLLSKPMDVSPARQPFPTARQPGRIEARSEDHPLSSFDAALAIPRGPRDWLTKARLGQTKVCRKRHQLHGISGFYSFAAAEYR